MAWPPPSSTGRIRRKGGTIRASTHTPNRAGRRSTEVGRSHRAGNFKHRMKGGHNNIQFKFRGNFLPQQLVPSFGCHSRLHKTTRTKKWVSGPKTAQTLSAIKRTTRVTWRVPTIYSNLKAILRNESPKDGWWAWIKSV